MSSSAGSTHPELSKTVDTASIEKKWYSHWEKTGAFHPDPARSETYTIVIPPPNVTGSLHIGHALNNTLQDILARFERLRGKSVLWQPGTDHAGIATQMVVERQLDQEGTSRKAMGRDAFVERVWRWKEESGGTITQQLRRLGSSCDWSRERFTMDDGLSAAVTKVFVQYYREGLLYRDKRLVNWDPKLKTAISDLEVEQREVQGHFWHFKYPLADDPSHHINVATTRPETMLGDTAVAVNPSDERYRDLIGKMVRLPLVDRLIPIVADEHADPEQGSGAVKITPAHDFNDFDVGQRNNLPMINVFDADARINDEAPEEFRSMDRFEARKAVVAALDELGLLIEVEDKIIQMPYGDRSGVVIEPWLTMQWYVDAETLAKPAISAVETGKTKFHPKNWEKTYYEWMRNIQPWCVSRQLWWGHQIPAWYDPDGNVYVAETLEQAQRDAGEGTPLTRDPDVLDTWFSSALWPFSTLGWPDENDPVLKRHYPTTTLVTAFDIIFFWVARMMMSGLHFMDEVPFKDVYITSLVRDANGKKMSKSLGNVIDPLDYIDRFGADALRFTLAVMESQGRDIKLAESRVEGYRNFGTKLWNATRFAQMNGISGSSTVAPPPAECQVNRWIIGLVGTTATALTKALEEFRFDAAANAIYRFTWHSFCDWYLELIKPLVANDDAIAEETRAVAGWVLDQILVMLHPFMPFITEELWHAQSSNRTTDLINATWPHIAQGDNTLNAQFDQSIELASAIRRARQEANIPPGIKMSALIDRHESDTGSAAYAEIKDVFEGFFLTATRLDRPEIGSAKDRATLAIGHAIPMFIVVEGVVDLEAERTRLEKSIAKAEKEANRLAMRLSKPSFVEKAPEKVVEETRRNQAAAEAEVQQLRAALRRLGGAVCE